MPKPKLTQADIAAQIGISRRTLSNWKADGTDTSQANLKVLQAKAEASKSRADITGEIAQARLRKLHAEAEAKEHALAVEKGRYVTCESQERAGLHAAQVIKSLILKIPTDLPQILVGLSYPEAVTKCEDFAYNLLTEISKASNYATAPTDPD